MRWIVKLAGRLATAVFVVLLGGLLSVTLARFAPGFGIDERLLDARLSHESVDTVRNEQSPERRILCFYADSLRRMARGDLGISRTLQRPVRELLSERIATSLHLITAGLAASWALTVALVLVTWFVDHPVTDTAANVVTGSLLCLPVGAVTLLLILVNGPAFLAIATAISPKLYRYLDSLVGLAKDMPHIITARAQGASKTRLLFRHVSRTMSGELSAVLGISLSMAIAATIPVEALFGAPGLGQLAWQAALGRDLPVLIHVSVLVIGCTVVANAGADCLSERQGIGQ